MLLDPQESQANMSTAEVSAGVSVEDQILKFLGDNDDAKQGDILKFLKEKGVEFSNVSELKKQYLVPLKKDGRIASGSTGSRWTLPGSESASAASSSSRQRKAPAPSQALTTHLNRLEQRIDEIDSKIDGIGILIRNYHADLKNMRSAGDFLPLAEPDPPLPSIGEFWELANPELKQLQEINMGRRLVPIFELFNRLRDRGVPEELFQRYLLKLEERGVISLTPHHSPATIPDTRKYGTISHSKRGLLYFISRTR